MILKNEEVIDISKKALKERIQLLDFINYSIKHKNERQNKIENPELTNVNNIIMKLGIVIYSDHPETVWNAYVD